MSIKVMKQALEALEAKGDAWVVLERKAKEALRQAIEQAEQSQPVAWIWKDGTITADPDRADGTWTPLYTAPPQRQPLTSDELLGLLKSVDPATARLPIGFIRFARAIEAAHGIKEEV
jgi:hypothetical protein